MEGQQLDEFLDTLPSSLRMKVVRELEPDDTPTEPIAVTSKPRIADDQRKLYDRHQTAPGRLTTGRKVLLVCLVAPVLLYLWALLWIGVGAKFLYDNLFAYTKEKLK